MGPLSAQLDDGEVEVASVNSRASGFQNDARHLERDRGPVCQDLHQRVHSSVARSVDVAYLIACSYKRTQHHYRGSGIRWDLDADTVYQEVEATPRIP
ncbi:hypothetical protein FRB95_010577 [Tulasnella sp. JGI-2019a]|nr:hypothetical protein FRB93_007763 [Tulasnella sp. JGI-2019a]KAG9025104.1 hypothetical protein FRB95_010577 [Tulasnella sp. JGI-2019a]